MIKMKVIPLQKSASLYSCNAYLILGDWNHLSDVNTLIDIGTDGFILAEIAKLSTGVGKKAVEQVILTHSHFDHAGGLTEVKKKYDPLVYAMSPIPHVNRNLKDGQLLRCGDREFEVIHTPGHSHDSVCLYNSRECVLFSGDTPLNVRSRGGSYSIRFLRCLERLCNKEIKAIYPGHGDPVTEKAQELMLFTLINVKNSQIDFI